MDAAPIHKRLARQAGSDRPALVLLSGLPGTGKSTWARRLSAATGADHVETDRLRRAMFPVRTYSGSEHAAVYGAAIRAVKRSLAKGRHVIFDATNLSEGARQPARRIAADGDAWLAIVQFDPPEDEVERRLAARRHEPHPADNSEADWEVYLALRPTYRPVAGPHWLVRSAGDDDAAIADLVALLTR
jgi:predicted kinase